MNRLNWLWPPLSIAFCIWYIWMHYVMPMPPEKLLCYIDTAELCGNKDIPPECEFRARNCNN